MACRDQKRRKIQCEGDNKRALDPSLLEGLNREEERGEEREIKKTALLEAYSWNAPRSDGGKRRDDGLLKGGARGSGCRDEGRGGRGQMERGNGKEGKTGMKSGVGRAWRYKKDGRGEIGCLVLIA